MTWSPTATAVTPSPTASTTPAPSWPSTAGSGFGVAPVITFQSLWQTPLATMRTVTSPGRDRRARRPRRSGAARSPGARRRACARFYGGARGRLAGMRMQAAVLWEPGRPVEILDVDLAPPRAGEVLVRIAACGVCHSDLHVVDGDLPEPLPLVLGHEAAGVVTRGRARGRARAAGGSRRARARALVRRLRGLSRRAPELLRAGRAHGRDRDARGRHIAALARRGGAEVTSTRSPRSPSTPSSPSRSPCHPAGHAAGPGGPDRLRGAHRAGER